MVRRDGDCHGGSVEIGAALGDDGRHLTVNDLDASRRIGWPSGDGRDDPGLRCLPALIAQVLRAIERTPRRLRPRKMTANRGVAHAFSAVFVQSRHDRGEPGRGRDAGPQAALGESHPPRDGDRR